MAREIELPDGTIAEFPDDMADDAIKSVLSKRFKPAPAAKPVTSAGDRFVTGIMDPIVGAAQLAEKIPGLVQARKWLTGSDTSMGDVTRDREANYVAPEGVDWMRMGGNVANPVSWASPGAGAARLAATGGIQAALAPVSSDSDFWTTKALQAGTGAVLAPVAQKLIGGFTPTREAQALMDQGVQPSFGQSMGGIANTVEQKATSIPIVGDAINYARRRAQQEFEAAALQKATGVAPPVPDRFGYVPRVTATAPRTLDEANDIARQQFERVVPHLQAAPEWLSQIPDTITAAAKNPELTAQTRRLFTGIMNDVLPDGRIQGLNGEQLKKLDSQLGFLTRKYSAGDPLSKSVADSIRTVHQQVRTELDHMLPSNMTGALNEANTTWARMVPVNKAASARADEVITPRALQRAMASQARTDVSRMPFDDLVDNAVKVLPSTVPDSGTAGRAMLGGGAIMGGSALGLLPQTLAAGAVAGLGATRPAQRYLTGNTSVQKALQGYDPNIAAMIVAALRGEL